VVGLGDYGSRGRDNWPPGTMFPPCAVKIICFQKLENSLSNFMVGGDK
jgi:hypothetical protein